jgi:hypothetical protein
LASTTPACCRSIAALLKSYSRGASRRGMHRNLAAGINLPARSVVITTLMKGI